MANVGIHAFLIILILSSSAYAIGQNDAANGNFNIEAYGRYSSSVGSWERLYPEDTNPYDYDGDGDVDLIGSSCTDSNCWFYVHRNSGGSFGSAEQFATIGQGDCYKKFNFENINRRDNSARDLVINCDSRGVWYDDGWDGGYFGSGFNNAGFTCWDSNAGYRQGKVVFGDFNNDGYNDYVCSIAYSDKFSVRLGLNTGGGNNPTWSVSSQFTTLFGNTRSGPVIPIVLDYNHDGCSDLVFIQDYRDSSYNPNVWYYIGNCAGGLTSDGTAQIGTANTDETYNHGKAPISSTYGNKFNGEPTWFYSRNIREDGIVTVTLDKDSPRFDLPPTNYDIHHLDGIEVLMDNGAPWIYITGTYYSDSQFGYPSTHLLVRAPIRSDTFINAGARSIGTTETDSFTVTFSEANKNAWRSNNYMKVPYSNHAWRVNSVMRTQPSQSSVSAASSAGSVQYGNYYDDRTNKQVLIGLPTNAGINTYSFTVVSQLAPDHNGVTSSLGWKNSVTLPGSWYSWNGGGGLSSTGCQYSVGTSSGATDVTGWTSCPQQPLQGQTSNFAPTFTVPSSHMIQGRNYINFRIKNTYNYEVQVNGVYNVDFDNVVPSTSTNYQSGSWTSSDVNMMLTCNDSTSGCSQTKYCIADEGQSCTPNTNGNSFTVSCNSDSVCSRQVYYYSIDNAGNQESTKSTVIRIDKQKPMTTYSISPTSPNGENGWYNSAPTITLSCSDGTGVGCSSILYCRSASNTCIPDEIYSGPFSVTQEHNPTYIIYRSTDSLSNAESNRVQSAKIDYTMPVPNPYNNPSVNVIDHDTQDISVSGTSDNIGITLYRYKKTNDESVQTSSSNTLTVNGLSENTRYGWQIQYKDYAGNTNSYGNATYKYTIVNGPSSISFESITNDTITIIATTFPNPSAGDSGYYFECTQGGLFGCASSGWQHDNRYVDSELTPNTEFSYREKNRNGDGVETSYSTIITNYTKASTPGLTLISYNNETATINIVQNNNPSYTNYTIRVTRGTTEYYVNSTGHIVGTLGNNSTWQSYDAWKTNSGFVIKGLSPNQSYTIKLKARNENFVETEEVSRSVQTLANIVKDLSVTTGVQFRGVVFFDGFEDGTLEPFTTTGKYYKWGIETYGGYHAGARYPHTLPPRPITDLIPYADLELNISLTGISELRFDKAVYRGAILSFYIDGVLIDVWRDLDGGGYYFEEVSYVLPAGSHNLLWRHSVGGLGKIDNVTITEWVYTHQLVPFDPLSEDILDTEPRPIL